MRRHHLRVVLLVVLLAAQALPALAQRPDAPPYARRGPYPVGTRELVIEGEYPLSVTLWYPALNAGGAPEAATYASGILAYQGRALRDAAIDPGGGPYPLVVFSHGLGALRFQSLYLTEHLASRGFVVIAADHPGTTTAEIILGAAGQDAAAGVARSFARRPLEVMREIAFAGELTAEGGAFAGAIDTGRIAVIGHSFGGYTTAAAAGARLNFAALRAWCADPVGLSFTPGADPAFAPLALPEQANCGFGLIDFEAEIAAARGLESVPEGLWPPTTDPRIRAAVMLAPSSAANFGAEGLAALTLPTLIVAGTADELTPAETNAFVYYQSIGSARKTLVMLENANHYLFANACPPLAAALGYYAMCSDAVWDLDRAHDLTNQFVTAFLLAELTGDAAALDALDPALVDFPGVRVLAGPGM